MVLGPLIVPWLKKLPAFMINPWIRYIEPDWNWARKYAAFKDMNSDVFLVVSGGFIVLWVSDADVASEIIARREDFPKPIESYAVLDLFGSNVVTTAGQHWRAHRKITAPPFNERNNLLVWQESVEKSQAMLKSWITPLPGSAQTPTIKTLSDDCMRVALHIIAWAGFRQKLKWPTRISEGKYDEKASDEEKLEKGHKMSFQASIHKVLVHIYLILGAPRLYLKHTPIKSHKQAYEAFVEFGNYLNEMVANKKKEMENGTAAVGDILSALVRGYYSGEKAEKGDAVITEQEVLGNCFIMILAGHETTANTLRYSIMMLAMHPELQIKLQDEINRILGDREPDYERDYQLLAEGWCGAIMNETLRFFPPVTNLPKSTKAPQPITYNKKTHIIPGGIQIHLNTIALHRNPRFWVPAGKTEEEAQPLSYRPERWLLEKKQTEGMDFGEEDGLAPEGKDTSKAFYRPYRGSFIPFSDGARACLGRKFANVEFVAILAILFRDYSVELEVKEGETWEDAKRRAWEHVEDSGSVITLQPKGPDIGVQWVKRGEEKYFQRRNKGLV